METQELLIATAKSLGRREANNETLSKLVKMYETSQLQPTGYGQAVEEMIEFLIKT